MFYFCWRFWFYLLKSFWYRIYKKQKNYVCMVGKTALITGSNSGIGYYTALELASRGCRVIMADVVDMEKSRNDIVRLTKNQNIVTKHLDLASNNSIRQFAKDINQNEDHLDVLVNNAGVGGFKNQPIMQINHFGPFLLTHLLLDLLKRSSPSRLIFVSSVGAFNVSVDENFLQTNVFDDEARCFQMYSNSKLCTMITSTMFADVLRDSGVTSNSLHPGLVSTPIYTKFAESFSISNIYVVIYLFILKLLCISKAPEEGAQTSVFLATSDDVRNISGQFFIEEKIFDRPSQLHDKQLCKKVWKTSEQVVELKENERIEF